MKTIGIYFSPRANLFMETVVQRLETAGYTIAAVSLDSLDRFMSRPLGEKWDIVFNAGADFFIGYADELNPGLRLWWINYISFVTRTGTLLQLGALETPWPGEGRVEVFPETATAEQIGEWLERELFTRQVREIESERRAAEKVENIQEGNKDHLDPILKDLKSRETSLRLATRYYNGAGSFLLLFAVGLSFYMIGWPAEAGNTWHTMLSQTISRLLLFGLIVGSARVSFRLAKISLAEALQLVDRQHAMEFGRFYLRARGADLTWDQLQQAFQHFTVRSGLYSNEHTSDAGSEIQLVLEHAYKQLLAVLKK